MSDCKHCGGKIDVQARIAEFCSQCSVFDEYMRRNHPVEQRDNNPWRPASEEPDEHSVYWALVEGESKPVRAYYYYYGWAIPHPEYPWAIPEVIAYCPIIIPDGWQQYVRDE